MYALDKDDGPIFADGEIDGERLNDNGAYLHAQDAKAVEWFTYPRGVSLKAVHETLEGHDDISTSALLSRLLVKSS